MKVSKKNLVKKHQPLPNLPRLFHMMFKEFQAAFQASVLPKFVPFISDSHIVKMLKAAQEKDVHPAI